jgi:hypothetical protein
MSNSKTKLYHTCPTKGPFPCITGDLTGEGFLVIVDQRTHELVIQQGATGETVTVAVSPRGAPMPEVSPRPGTRMLDLPPSSSDPMQQAGESIERLKRPCVERDVAKSARRGVELAWRRRRGRAIHLTQEES